MKTAQLNTANKNIGFRLTLQLDCPDMIDEHTFRTAFDSDALTTYKFISDDFNDNPFNFSEKYAIIKIELL